MPEPLTLPEDRALLDHLAERFNTSPMLSHFGTRLSFPTNELVRVVIDPIPLHLRGGLGSDQAVNGGVLAAMFDLALGIAGYTRNPHGTTATVQLNLNYMRPVTGAKLVTEAWIERGGKSLLFTVGHILGEDGKPAAHATAVVRVMSDRPPDPASKALPNKR